MTDDEDKTSASRSSWQHPRGKGGVALAVVGLLLVGGVAMLAAPMHGNQPSQGQSSGSATAAAPTRVADSTGTALATVTATDSPPPTPTPPTAPQTPSHTPVPPPTPPPTPSATPAPSWHTVGTWNGNSAGTAGVAALGNGRPVRLLYTCAVTSPAWTLQVAFMSDAGAGWGMAGTTCDGTSRELDISSFTDNPGGNGTGIFTVSAPVGTIAAWTLRVEVWY